MYNYGDEYDDGNECQFLIGNVQQYDKYYNDQEYQGRCQYLIGNVQH